MAVGDSVNLVGHIAADPGLDTGTVLWWSTDTLVASVNARGRVVAKSLGTATIVASVAADPTFKAIAVVGVLTDEVPHIPAKKN